MKVTLEFNLPEDQQSLKHALEGSEVVSSAASLDEYLKRRIKHENCSEDVQKTLEECRDKLWELFGEYIE